MAKIESIFEEFVDYIRENYPRAGKIIEVGVGQRVNVAERVKESLPLAEILVTDQNEASMRSHATKKVRVVADDLMFPQRAIYDGASLIYSINPPVEIVPPMVELAERVGADLVILPRSDEQEYFTSEEWKRIVRAGRILGWRRFSAREARRDRN